MSADSTTAAIFSGAGLSVLVMTVISVSNILTSYVLPGGSTMQEWLNSNLNITGGA